MPPRVKITKENIILASVDLVRESGADALNARALAARLGCSTQPIFSNYTTMEDLRHDVILSANQLYRSYLQRDMEKGDYPPYKASGIAYIRFAREERELFKLLFMRDRSREQTDDSPNEMQDLLSIVRANTGLNEEQAYLFHIEMWIYVHGIATMLATSYLELDWDTISGLLTDAYEGLKSRYQASKPGEP